MRALLLLFQPPPLIPLLQADASKVSESSYTTHYVCLDKNVTVFEKDCAGAALSSDLLPSHIHARPWPIHVVIRKIFYPLLLLCCPPLLSSDCLHDLGYPGPLLHLLHRAQRDLSSSANVKLMPGLGHPRIIHPVVVSRPRQAHRCSYRLVLAKHTMTLQVCLSTGIRTVKHLPALLAGEEPRAIRPTERLDPAPGAYRQTQALGHVLPSGSCWCSTARPAPSWRGEGRGGPDICPLSMPKPCRTRPWRIQR